MGEEIRQEALIEAAAAATVLIETKFPIEGFRE